MLFRCKNNGRASRFQPRLYRSHRPTVGLCDPSVRLSLACYSYCRTLIGNPMLEVKPAGRTDGRTDRTILSPSMTPPPSNCHRRVGTGYDWIISDARQTYPIVNLGRRTFQNALHLSPDSFRIVPKISLEVAYRAVRLMTNWLAGLQLATHGSRLLVKFGMAESRRVGGRASSAPPSATPHVNAFARHCIRSRFSARYLL